MKVILFDFDGVIVDTFAFCHRISSLRSPVSEEEYRSKFEGNINDALKKDRPVSASPFDFFSYYTPELMKCRPHEQMAEMITALAERYTLIIVSSTISQPISDFLTLYGLRSAFTEILGNDVEKSKQKKIQAVLQRYHLQPSETVFVTDTLGDMREADACGVRSIGVTWGFHPVETLEKGHPLTLVNSAREILETIKGMDAGKDRSAASA